MKIRQKITLWIAGTAFAAAVGFSGYVFHELLEEPYKIIDRELENMSQTLLAQLASGHNSTPTSFLENTLPYPPDQFWIVVTDELGMILYQSELTRFFDIPRREDVTTYNIERIVPRDQVRLGQDAEDEVLLRVRISHSTLKGKKVTVTVAKPIEELEEEVEELVWRIIIGLIVCTLFIAIASSYLAGRILRPIVGISGLVRKISESSLDQRIPLGKNNDELRELAVSLNRMFDRLQFSFNRQKEFVGNAAHELKSPITLMMLALEELSQSPHIDEAARNDLIHQMDILRRMKRLVKNLLDLSRLEQQENISSQRVDLTELVASVLAEYEAVIHGGSIRVDNRLKGDLLLEGDREKLQRLFINLFDNAWRYNLQADGRIRITGSKKEGWIELEISNTGPGIPRGELCRVFDQFYRVEKSRSLSSGGSGLGLTIARKIVDLHGGHIDILSEPDGWTQVRVTLPAKI